MIRRLLVLAAGVLLAAAAGAQPPAAPTREEVDGLRREIRGLRQAVGAVRSTAAEQVRALEARAAGDRTSIEALERRVEELRSEAAAWRAAALTLGLLVALGMLFGVRRRTAPEVELLRRRHAGWKDRLAENEERLAGLDNFQGTAGRPAAPTGATDVD